MQKTMIKLCGSGDLAPGEGRVVETEGRCFAVFNVEGIFYAIDNTCAHRGGPLGEGTLAGELVTCPWHRAQFNVKTGEVCQPPARTGVTAYPVKVEGDNVFIELA